MYPLRPDELFAPLNQWYVAGFVEDLGRTPLERWLLGEPVVLYRGMDGRPIALDGHCPHRHLPLARGKLLGDELQCSYHGIRFAADGRCVHVPTQTAVPAACRVRAYPVVDRGLWTWIWPGEVSHADPALIPAAAAGTAPRSTTTSTPIREHRHVHARYVLLHDNLLDLSHLEYLHAGGIGSNGGAAVIETHSEGPDWVSSEHYQASTPCPSYFEDIFGYHGPVQRRFGMTCHVPSLHVGFDDFSRVPAAGEAEGTPLGRFHVYHAITPAGPHETHYFVAADRNFATAEESLTQAMSAALSKTLDEDVAATEGIEAMLGRLPREPSDVLVKGDLNCVRGRQRFEAMIRAETRRGSAHASQRMGRCPASMNRSPSPPSSK